MLLIHKLMMVVIIVIITTVIIYWSPHLYGTASHNEFFIHFPGVTDKNSFEFLWQINASHALTQYFIIVTHFATYVRSTQHSSTAELVC